MSLTPGNAEVEHPRTSTPLPERQDQEVMDPDAVVPEAPAEEIPPAQAQPHQFAPRPSVVIRQRLARAA